MSGEVKLAGEELVELVARAIFDQLCTGQHSAMARTEFARQRRYKEAARAAIAAIAAIEATRPPVMTGQDGEGGESVLVEKDKLDRVSLEQSFTTDPVERMVADALSAAGFEWRHEGHPARRDDPVTLDFQIIGGPHVEVKRFHTPRVEKQLAQAENVILVQGIEAARWFASALAR